MEVNMKLLRLFIAVIFLMVAGVALAGKGGPVVSGYWEGYGQAMYPDGTIVEIALVEALLVQEGNFIYGGAEFTVIIDDISMPPQAAQMSGHISGNEIKGLLGGCISEAPDCLGSGVFEGKLCGNKMTGTIMDLGDGSTSVVTLHRMPD